MAWEWDLDKQLLIGKDYSRKVSLTRSFKRLDMNMDQIVIKKENKNKNKKGMGSGL